MGGLEAFFWAAAAGLAVSVLDYAAMAGLPRRQRRFDLTDPAYLLKFAGHPLAGGVLAAAYAESRQDATALVAVVLGAAAPGIWRTIVRSGAAIARLLLGTLARPSRGQTRV
jgi:ABC-type Fe3+ transport system substrate-binding protein